MIRIGAIAVGLFFAAVVFFWSFVPGVMTYFTEPSEKPAEYAFHEKSPGPEGGFSFDGPFGTWDYAQLQRGYQVYKEVCAACHSLQYVAFRNLEELTFTEAEVKAEAAQLLG